MWALINILSKQNGHSSRKKSYLSRIVRPPFAEPFCHPIFRKNMVYLSRNFRLPFAEPFCRSLSRKKKSYFRKAFAKLSRTTFEALQWSSFTKSFTRGFWSILMYVYLQHFSLVDCKQGWSSVDARQDDVLGITRLLHVALTGWKKRKFVRVSN